MVPINLTILATTPMPLHIDSLDEALDTADRERLQRNPHLASRIDWQSSRYLKQKLVTSSHHTISLSHKKGHAALIVINQTQAAVGIDLEYCQERDFLALSQLFCTKIEQQWLAEQVNRPLAFYQLWTLKESLIKVHHAELADLKKFSLIQDVSDSIRIPCFQQIPLIGLSLQLSERWLLSAVFPDPNLSQNKVKFRGYGDWHKPHVEPFYWPSSTP